MCDGCVGQIVLCLTAVSDGQIVLALGRRLWLSPLVRRRQHQLYQTSATLLDPSLASQLLERGFGQRAPGHLDALYALCQQAGLPILPQWKPSGGSALGTRTSDRAE